MYGSIDISALFCDEFGNDVYDIDDFSGGSTDTILGPCLIPVNRAGFPSHSKRGCYQNMSRQATPFSSGQPWPKSEGTSLLKWPDQWNKQHTGDNHENIQRDAEPEIVHEAVAPGNKNHQIRLVPER